MIYLWSPGFDSQQTRFPVILGEQGETRGENHGKRTLDQSVESVESTYHTTKIIGRTT